MGQKANPIVMRLGIIKESESIWFDYRNYKDLLYEDFLLRARIKEELSRSGLSKISIFRRRGEVEINVRAAKPGIIIGKGGSDISYLREELMKLTSKKVTINITEEKNIDGSSKLLAEGVAQQLEKRIPFRRAMKSSVQKAMKAGVEGVKIACSGRLGGVEIARSEWYREGKVPLHTLRADIDYSFTEALTTYGKIGVKVWVYKGEIFDEINKEDSLKETKEERIDGE